MFAVSIGHDMYSRRTFVLRLYKGAAGHVQIDQAVLVFFVVV